MKDKHRECGKEQKYSGHDMDPSTRLHGNMHHKRIPFGAGILHLNFSTSCR